MAAGLQGLRCRLFPAPSVRWLKAGNSPSAQTARLFTLHLLQSLYRKQSEACPCSPPALCDLPGLLSFFKLVYHHCRFVALGRGLPPPVFYKEEFCEWVQSVILQGRRSRPSLYEEGSVQNIDCLYSRSRCGKIGGAFRGAFYGLLFCGECGAADGGGLF